MTIQIYSKDNCPQCAMAENMLKAKGKEYTVLKLDVDFTKEQLLEKALPFVPRAFPVVFYPDGTVLGDFTALRAALQKGLL
jgi:glutaredoxin 3